MIYQIPDIKYQISNNQLTCQLASLAMTQSTDTRMVSPVLTYPVRDRSCIAKIFSVTFMGGRPAGRRLRGAVMAPSYRSAEFNASSPRRGQLGFFVPPEKGLQNIHADVRRRSSSTSSAEISSVHDKAMPPRLVGAVAMLTVCSRASLSLTCPFRRKCAPKTEKTVRGCSDDCFSPSGIELHASSSS